MRGFELSPLSFQVAAHPASPKPDLSNTEHAFRIAGLTADTSSYTHTPLESGMVVSLATITLTNPTPGITISNIALAFGGLYGQALPEGVAISVRLGESTGSLPQTSLSAMARTRLILDLNISDDFAGTILLAVRVRDPTYNSFLPVVITIPVVPPKPKIVVSPTRMNTVLLRGRTSFRTIRVTNVGSDATQRLQVVTPVADWITTMTPFLDPLQPGQSADVTFQFTPSRTAALTRLTAYFRVECAEACPYLRPASVALSATIATNSSYSVTVVVEDEYTYFADGKPNVTGAVVQLRGRSRSYSKRVTTGTNGTVVFDDVPEGAYEVKAQALKHEADSELIEVNEDLELVSMFLPRATVSYVWTVTPTRVEDKYEFKLEAVFEVSLRTCSSCCKSFLTPLRRCRLECQRL